VIFSRWGYATQRDLCYDRSRILSIVLLKEAELAVLLSGGDAFIFSRKAILVETDNKLKKIGNVDKSKQKSVLVKCWRFYHPGY
jgi:hypothetical protein